MAETTSIEISKCDAEDLRKIHTELNQILNQRFLLVTTAVTVFGAFSAFMVPKINDLVTSSTNKAGLEVSSSTPTVTAKIASELAMRTQFENFVFIATLGLLAVFCLLFYINWTLLKNQNILASYLRVFELSPWERRINNYYAKGVAGTRLYYFAYLFLGVLVFGWPYVIFLAARHVPSHGPVILHLIICFLFFLFVILCQKSACNVLGIEKRWEEVKCEELRGKD